MSETTMFVCFILAIFAAGPAVLWWCAWKWEQDRRDDALFADTGNYAVLPDPNPAPTKDAL